MTPAHLLRLARPHQAGLLLAMAITLVQSALLLAFPWFAGRMAGLMLDGPDAAVADLQPLAGLLAALIVAVAALRAGLGMVTSRIATRMLAGLRTQVHDHLQSLPLAVHQRHTSGDLLALSTYEVGRLSQLLAGTVVAFPAQLLTALGAVVLMARLDPALALVVPALVPLFYLALKVVGRRLRRIAQATQEAEAEVVAVASEDLAMLPATKAFTREGPAARRFADRVGRARALVVAEDDLHALLGAGMWLASSLGALALLLLAGRSIQSGALSPAEAVSFLLYAALLTGPVAGLADVYGAVQSARGTLARLGRLLDEPAEPGGDAPPLVGRARGELAFDDVEFAYPDREPALRGLSLRVRAGETLAVTGPNGAGKTTLAFLLLRFADPRRGAVRLDGVDLRDIRLADLRRQIGLVPQRPLLFGGTVRENIGFGREGATEAEIEAAARLAQAHDFVQGLPEGYDTRIGDNGVRLSGGQGQRVALARALLKDPAVLILDEATSMFDLDGERAFVELAATALKDRTVILITHRPATLALADRVVTLEDGRIAAERSAA